MSHYAISKFAANCPNLQRLTWHNSGGWQNSGRSGAMSWLDYIFLVVVFSRLQLKELFMDNTVLDHTENDDSCIFFHLRDTLERASIKNLAVKEFRREALPISQAALVKFVRRMPHLCWLRSDLDAENIAMLKAERPEIEFVSD